MGNQQSSPILALQQQRLLLQMEYAAEKEAYRKQTEDIGLQRKVKRGDAWYPLKLGKSYYNSLNQLVIEVFRQGDEDIEHNFEFGRPVVFFSVKNEESRMKSYDYQDSSLDRGLSGNHNSSLFTHNSSIKYFPFTATVSYVDRA